MSTSPTEVGCSAALDGVRSTRKSQRDILDQGNVSVQNVAGELLTRPTPAEMSGQPLVLCSFTDSQHHSRNSEQGTEWRELTKPVFHPSPIRLARLGVADQHDVCDGLAVGENISQFRHEVFRVGSLGGLNATEPCPCCGSDVEDRALTPVPLRLLEYGLVEGQDVSKVSIGAAVRFPEIVSSIMASMGMLELSRNQP
jgi:hypothetical protein